MKPELLRALPKMDLLLARPALAGSPLPYALRRQAARQVLDEYRAALRAGALSAVPGLDELEQSVLRRGAELARPALGRVINATGVVLHTNLGRAPLSPRAAAAVGEAAGAIPTWSTISPPAARGPPGGGRRVPPVRPHRRGGGPGGQQQRRRRVSPPLRPGDRAGGGHLPGGAGGDRRGLPGARHPGPQRGPAGGGGHHQQDPPGRLRRRPGRGGGPGAAQGTPQQLPHRGLHPGGLPARARCLGPEPGRAPVLRSRLRRPRLPGAGPGRWRGPMCAASPGTSCWADPRRGFCWGRRNRSAVCGPTPLSRALRPRQTGPGRPRVHPAGLAGRDGGAGVRHALRPAGGAAAAGGGPWQRPSPPSTPARRWRPRGRWGAAPVRGRASLPGRRPWSPQRRWRPTSAPGRVPILGRIHRGKLLLDVRTLLPGDEAEIAAALAAWREERA